MKKIIIFTVLFLILFKINTEAYSFGLKINNGKRPEITDKEREIIEKNNGKYIGEDTNVIYLTFDCGYENGYTLDILDTLKKTDVRACFFITGHYLESSEDIVNKMIEDGHIIGNHTLNHKDFSKLNASQVLKEVTLLEENFYQKTNTKMSKYVRPPRGEFSEGSQKVLSENGYKSVFWSLAYVDWHKNVYNGNHYSYDKVVSRIHNGAVILMHAVSKDNCEDLEDIIMKLKSDGYVFETMDYLFYD